MWSYTMFMKGYKMRAIYFDMRSTFINQIQLTNQKVWGSQDNFYEKNIILIYNNFNIIKILPLTGAFFISTICTYKSKSETVTGQQFVSNGKRFAISF